MKKNTNTDEFFVKQRQPLTLPPDYDTLPKPKSTEDSNKNVEDEQIGEIIKIKKEKKKLVIKILNQLKIQY